MAFKKYPGILVLESVFASRRAPSVYYLFEYAIYYTVSVAGTAFPPLFKGNFYYVRGAFFQGPRDTRHYSANFHGQIFSDALRSAVKVSCNVHIIVCEHQHMTNVILNDTGVNNAYLQLVRYRYYMFVDAVHIVIDNIAVLHFQVLSLANEVNRPREAITPPGEQVNRSFYLVEFLS